jgi:L-alanine-DL-glutamate epimerase-like enolase superfamily enzyme
MVRRRMFKISRSKEQYKLQWLEDPSETNGDNLNTVRREAAEIS